MNKPHFAFIWGVRPLDSQERLAYKYVQLSDMIDGTQDKQTEIEYMRTYRELEESCNCDAENTWRTIGFVRQMRDKIVV